MAIATHLSSQKVFANNIPHVGSLLHPQVRGAMLIRGLLAIC